MRKIDLDYCCSSYLAFRYIYDNEVDFFPNTKHQVFKQIKEKDKFIVDTIEDIDFYIEQQIESLRGKKLGILLSGGMDSAVLASYMKGCDAYTFRFLGGHYSAEETNRAKHYAEINNMKLHFVDINWDVVQKNLYKCMKSKNAPVHSIEPQILEAVNVARKDGIEVMIIGDAADYVFGGMNLLLSKDWKFDEFYERFIYVNPLNVLNNPINMKYVFEKYRIGTDGIDFLKIMDDITTDESYASYANAFKAGAMDYYDPYERLKLKSPLDLNRIRKGESKYLIRLLFKKKYPKIDIPEKVPMPRPVDLYFKDWCGPNNTIFKKDIDIKSLTGNQKWLIWCLDCFLDKFGKKYENQNTNDCQ